MPLTRYVLGYEKLICKYEVHVKFRYLRVGFWKFNSSVCGFFLFALEGFPEEERAEGEDAGAEFEELAAALRTDMNNNRVIVTMFGS